MYGLGRDNKAAQAAMAGKTNRMGGLHHDRHVHLPISMIGARKTIDPQSWFWQTVLQATHQPGNMLNK